MSIFPTAWKLTLGVHRHAGGDLNPPCSPGPGSWSLHRAALREWPLGLLLSHGAGPGSARVTRGDL